MNLKPKPKYALSLFGYFIGTSIIFSGFEYATDFQTAVNIVLPVLAAVSLAGRGKG